MIRNYLKVAFRNVWKQSFYSLLNIVGLAVGIASVLLMVLYVQSELSYDRYYDTADRIHRVHFRGTMSDNPFDMAVVTPHAGPAMLEEYPEVEDYGRFRNTGTWILEYEGEKYRESDVVYADHGIARLFDFQFLMGDQDSALDKPNQVVITEEIAKKYFGQENPLGKVFRRDDGEDFAVAGVIEAIPPNTHFDFNIFASVITRDETENSLWLSNNYQTYIQLYPGAEVSTVEAKFPGTIEKYMGPELEQFIGKSIEAWAEEGNLAEYYTVPLTDIHLKSNADGEIGANGDQRYVVIFSLAGLFVLLIACINFMNLATARSAGRAKEVGIRKTLGSVRRQLIGQFLAEAFVLSMISFLLGLVLAGFALPGFNQLADKNLTFATIDWYTLLPIMVALALLVSLLAGSYPAFYLSAFRPVAVLKGKVSSGMKHKWLRSGLVVVQFSASIILIICTLVVSKQMHHIRNQNLGYDKEQLISVTRANLLGGQLQTYKEEMLRQPEFAHGTICSSLPVPSSSNNTFFFPGANPDDPRGTSLQVYSVDFDYLETMGMKVLYGRDFDVDLATDSTAIILNEAAMQQFQWSGDDALDKTVGTFDENLEPITYQVIGVVEDFAYENLRYKINPLVMIIGPSTGRVTFKVKAGESQAAIAALENTWDELSGGQPFDYEFVDDKFDAMYDADQRRGTLFTVFAGLAIFTACLGLFGLAAFTAEQRHKEIGVRKVLGASIPGLLLLLSREFMALVGIAFVVATAVAGYLMHLWLQDFASRTSLSWWVFALAGGTALLIAGLTMSTQSLRAALANPVKSLRSE